MASLTDAVIAALDIPAAAAARPAGVTNQPFVVLWPSAPTRSAHTIGDPSGTQTTVLTCHCVGLSEESALIAEAKLAAAVLGLYGTAINGQTVGYPEQLGAPALIRDDSLSPALYDLAVEWRFRTTPA